MPRFFSPPHPEAVASRGDEFVAFAEARRGGPLRWFQWLTAQRRYEVRADGSWCWLLVFESTPRQQGKSVSLAEDAAWYPSQTPDPELILHTAHRVKTSLKIQGELWPWAATHGYEVRRLLGDSHITWPNGSDWATIAMESAYGARPHRLLADEAWALDPFKFWNSLFPALGDRENPQVLFFSTAQPQERGLVADLRKDPEVCRMEWGVLPSEDHLDPAVWQASSAYWGPGRERLMRTASTRPGFAPEWLNEWPEVSQTLPGKDLVPADAWSALHVPDLHVNGSACVAAMESTVGAPPAVAVAWRMADGRSAVIGRLLPSLGAAWAYMGGLPPGTQHVVGLSWRKQQAAVNLMAEGFGQRETAVALPMLRDRVKAGTLAWAGDELAEQVTAMRVIDSPGAAGTSVVRSGQLTHLARAAAWALMQLEQTPPPPAVW